MINDGWNATIWIDLCEPVLLLFIFGKIDVFCLIFEAEFLARKKAGYTERCIENTSNAMDIFCPFGVAAVRSWIIIAIRSVTLQAHDYDTWSCR